MAGSTREIRRRVKAVKNIRQITRAMELVSAAKMQRAVTAVGQSRRYAELARETLNAVTANIGTEHHPLLARRSIARMLVVLITSNRGLAGGFNSKVEEATRQFIRSRHAADPALAIDVITVGKKGREYAQKIGFNIIADFDFGDRINAGDVASLVQLVFSAYEAQTYDEVNVVYSHFVSMLTQEPRVLNVLPLQPASADTEYLFEPSASEVLSALVPRLLETQMYQTLVESRASEQAARMVAMRNATEAAGDLIGDLTLTYNQLRQSSITQELAEISAGRLALGV